jgi:predicted ATPase
VDNLQRIVFIGGPGTGKSTLLKLIENQGYKVHHEISREVTASAQKQGVEQLFLEDPLNFSNQLLHGRIQQFENAINGLNFYDRGIPDVPAYHHYTNDPIPQEYLDASKEYRYDQVFFLPPWKEIYTSDQERYESYDQAMEIAQILLKFYRSLDYQPIKVPKMSLGDRLRFIIDHVNDHASL